jgi:hypothetical protein
MSQSSSSILMIRPVSFGYNTETAETNTFQSQATALQPAQIQEIARSEFDAFVIKLRAAGIDVIVFDDTLQPHKPDSIFPNNWVSFHEDGRVVLYPMQAQNRRLERKADLIYQLKDNFGFGISEIIDLSYFEREDKFLEGTGSMILDRDHKIAYACLSPRTNAEVLKVFCDKMGYAPHTITAIDKKGVPVYHTNVLMALGENFAIICLEAIPDESEREKLTQSLENTGKIIIPITYDQMLKFAGNMLQVRNTDGKEILVMSDSGYNSLSDEQYDALYNRTGILHANLNCIETYGGGSARCMMAEIFSPKIVEEQHI